MIAVDTNVLVEAHKHESPWHDQALAALRALVRSAEPVALPWPCLHECYSVAAICLAHGVCELLTMDRDVSRYPGLKTRSLVA